MHVISTLVAAFDPSLNEKAGAYLSDGQVNNEKVAPHSSDPVSTHFYYYLLPCFLMINVSDGRTIFRWFSPLGNRCALVGTERETRWAEVRVDLNYLYVV